MSQDGKNVPHNTFGYTGEMWDEESNLLYLRARYYEPLSRDTYEGELENPLSKHLYAYVGNNPVNYVDPTGHWDSRIHYDRTLELAEAKGFDTTEARIIAQFNSGVDTNSHGITMGLGDNIKFAGQSWHENTTNPPLNNFWDDFTYNNLNYTQQNNDEWHLNFDLYDKVYGRIYSSTDADSALMYFDIPKTRTTYEQISYRLTGLNLYNKEDSRIKLAEVQLQYAQDLIDYANKHYKGKDGVRYNAIRKEALIHIGMGLHAVQDVVAHQYPSNQSLKTSHFLSAAKIKNKWGYAYYIVPLLPDDPGYDYLASDIYIPGTIRDRQVTENTNIYLGIAKKMFN